MAARADQRIGRALLDNPTAIEHDHPIRLSGRREPVRALITRGEIGIKYAGMGMQYSKIPWFAAKLFEEAAFHGSPGDAELLMHDPAIRNLLEQEGVPVYSHIAAALHVPSVVVYLGSSPQRWAPLDGMRHRRVYRAVDCRPCEYLVCPIGHACANGVFPEDVMEEVKGLL